MDNKRKSFAFFRSYWEAAKQIEDPLARLEFYEALCETSFTGKTQNVKNNIANLAYTLILPTILKGISKYENGSKNGGKNVGKEEAAEEEIFKEKEIGEERKERNGSETEAKPKLTLSEISQYIAEKGYHVDAERFFNYMESIGWKSGNNVIVNWKATLKNWEKNEKQQVNKPKQKKTTFNNFEGQRDYDYDELEKQLVANQ